MTGLHVILEVDIWELDLGKPGNNSVKPRRVPADWKERKRACTYREAQRESYTNVLT